jgi:hypothetical protein
VLQPANVRVPLNVPGEVMLAVEVIITAGIGLWLFSNAVVHLIDYCRARYAVRAFANRQAEGGDTTSPSALELRRAAFPPMLSLVLVLNVILQVVIAIPFAVSALEFMFGDSASGDRWARYAFAAFTALWCLFLFADPWVQWVPRNALERKRSLWIVCGIVGFAIFSLGP